MEPVQDNAVVRVVARSQFEQQQLIAVEWGGRPVWSARNVGTALGYADANKIPSMISNEWSDELVPETDYLVARGEELAALKVHVPDLVDRRAPSLMLLTESGVNLVALLSRQPKARALRRWLADEVLPAIRREGAYTAPRRRPTALELGGWMQRTGGSSADAAREFGVPLGTAKWLARSAKREQAERSVILASIFNRLMDADARTVAMVEILLGRVDRQAAA